MDGNEIIKHIEDTNANYRDVSRGDAKNTDLFLNQEYFDLFKNAGKNSGDKITVRLHKDNLSQAILFIASILPRKYDHSAVHEIVSYSQSFVFNQLAILNAAFQNNGIPVDTIEREWTLRIGTTQKNGKIDSRFYINGLIEHLDYEDINGNLVKACFTIRNYLAGGFSNLHIKEINGIFDISITNSKDAYFDNSDPVTEKEIEESEEPGHGVHDNKTIIYKTDLAIEDFSRNRIIFGAPGTGKSYTLNEDRKKLLGENNINDYERVTFHPDYSYSNFVGTYKPVMVERCTDNASDASDIAYEYVPGPLMRMYVKALESAQTEDPQPFLLIVEEINRANVAAVFGDIFQLLDRGDDNVSEYPIQASEDIKRYLAKELGGNPENYSQIRIPDNLFIWATMNSADQGVFPMDTAFKRRWDFTYLGINDNDGEIANLSVEINGKTIYWNALRKAINDYLAKIGINEDKQLGPFFLKKDVIGDGKKFCEVFKHKIIMYLFEDAAKQKRASVFSGLEREKLRYSKICEEFDKRGIEIFDKEIQKNYADYTAYDDAVNNYNTQMQNDEES